jgi:N-glycosidase YbiA
MSTIMFYTANAPFGCFSNFSHHGFELDDLWWPTSEHYFQAQKFTGTTHEELVRLAPSPKAAARMGRDRSRPLRTDWEAVKDDVMRRAVLRKFERHADLRAVLLGTGDKEIIENSPSDSYWGCGADGQGKNMLGKILMETRDILRERAAKADAGAPTIG